MGLFSRRLSPEELQDKLSQQQAAAPEEQQQADDGAAKNFGALSAEITIIKGKLESFNEMRKASSERFSRISEQIGELRGMLMDANKSMGEMEVKTTKAVDLVQTVQPEKLMIDVRKIDGKVEGLRAQLEGSDLMMKTMMNEMKEMRNQLRAFRGVEQIVKLNEDVKKELMEIQKVKAVVERHSDKVETMFSEIQNKFSDIESFNSKLKSLASDIKNLQDGVDTLKVTVMKKSDKKEVETIIKKFNNFETHVGNIMELLTRKSDFLKKDLDTKLERSRELLQMINELKLEDPNLERNARRMKTLLEGEKKDADSLTKKEGKEQEIRKGFFSLFGKKKSEGGGEGGEEGGGEKGP